jgi:hypothetical protein
MEVVKMETEIKLRGWIDLFNEGKFDDIDVKVQIDAGWYDWFCKDTSLKNKTKKMGNIIKQIKDGGKVNLDETYVWFKNNCPVAHPLYDDFRIARIDNKEVQFTVQISSPWENKRYTVYGISNVFLKPLFETDSSRELVKWLNEGVNQT